MGRSIARGAPSPSSSGFVRREPHRDKDQQAFAFRKWVPTALATGRCSASSTSTLRRASSGHDKATDHVPAVGRRETARRRLMRGDNEPAVPSPV
jgi:hypothetical protein